MLQRLEIEYISRRSTAEFSACNLGRAQKELEDLKDRVLTAERRVRELTLVLGSERARAQSAAQELETQRLRQACLLYARPTEVQAWTRVAADWSITGWAALARNARVLAFGSPQSALEWRQRQTPGDWHTLGTWRHDADAVVLARPGEDGARGGGIDREERERGMLARVASRRPCGTGPPACAQCGRSDTELHWLGWNPFVCCPQGRSYGCYRDLQNWVSADSRGGCHLQYRCRYRQLDCTWRRSEAVALVDRSTRLPTVLLELVSGYAQLPGAPSPCGRRSGTLPGTFKTRHPWDRTCKYVRFRRRRPRRRADVANGSKEEVAE